MDLKYPSPLSPSKQVISKQVDTYRWTESKQGSRLQLLHFRLNHRSIITARVSDKPKGRRDRERERERERGVRGGESKKVGKKGLFELSLCAKQPPGFSGTRQTRFPLLLLLLLLPPLPPLCVLPRMCRDRWRERTARTAWYFFSSIPWKLVIWAWRMFNYF